MHRLPMGLLALALAFSILPAEPARAGNGETPNVIMIILDDFGWSELPFFTQPVEWPAPGSQHALEDQEREKTVIRPALNRLAARLLAPATCANGTRDCIGNLGSYRGRPVVPIDVDDPAHLTSPPASFYVDPDPPGPIADAPAAWSACRRTDCDPSAGDCTGCDYDKDLLSGYGGLDRLAREGVRFSRFYASSARCAPTRGSIFAGRYIKRPGVPRNNGKGLNPREITIAEYLKQGCTDATKGPLCPVADGQGEVPCAPVTCDPSAPPQSPGGRTYCANLPCYTTGLIGKWHLGGSRGKAPWERAQGWDEFIGFKGAKRSYVTTRPLRCGAPLHTKTCDDNELCQTNADCGGGSACTDYGNAIGLYVGPEPDYNPCVAGSPDFDPRVCCQPALNRPKSNLDLKRTLDEDGHRFWVRDGKRGGKGLGKVYKCSADNSAPTSETGCPYSVRMFRDFTRSFIIRHATGQPAGNPFFLTVGLHATHFPQQAPKRTAAHYVTADPYGTTVKTTNPNADLWAITEEFDAALGQIMEALDSVGTCPGDPSKTCRVGSELGDCGSNYPCTNLASENTVVILLSDQGRAGGAPFGNPLFRAGKTSVYEGGIRIPLIVWGPGMGNGDYEVREEALGSQVDLLPTIADIAGMPVPAQRVLPDETQGAGSGQSGEERHIDGVSLRGILAGTETTARDAIFASYGQGETVATRKGCFDGQPNMAGAVCGYRDPVDPGPGAMPSARGASCTPCEEPAACSQEECKLLDGFCVNRSACDTGGRWGCFIEDPSDPSVGQLSQCVNASECPAGQVCSRSVSVHCNTCDVASWKLNDLELYDLTTNPDEDRDVDCSAYAPAEPTIANVRDYLQVRLHQYDKCNDDEDGTMNRSPCVVGDPFICPTAPSTSTTTTTSTTSSTLASTTTTSTSTTTSTVPQSTTTSTTTSTSTTTITST